jgi:hypothetical protein
MRVMRRKTRFMSPDHSLSLGEGSTSLYLTTVAWIPGMSGTGPLGNSILGSSTLLYRIQELV